jgi:hypothetical protein
MNNILVLFVILVVSLAVWLRIRKDIQGDHTQPWFTFLKVKDTDPHTFWFDLLRKIQGDAMLNGGSMSNEDGGVAPPRPEVPPVITNTTTSTTSFVPPTNPPPAIYLQWSTKPMTTLLRPDGMTPDMDMSNDVGWWEPVHQANVVNTFAVRGKENTKSDTILIIF